MKLHKKLLGLLLSVSLFTVSMPLQSHAEDVTAGRISGMDRYSTSATVSEKTFKQSDYAIVVSGDKFPDALSASQLATAVDCPILLTNSRYLNSSVRDELIRLEVKHILIIGGTSSVSTNVSASLSRIADTSRLAGSNRYETSYLVAKLTLKNNPNINSCVVAGGSNFADALSASTYVSAYGCIMILNDGNTPVPMSGMNVVLVGGRTPNPSNDTADKRIYGSNRYETSLKVAMEVYPNPENAVFASGENYPDALASISVLNKADKAPLILTNGHSVSAGVRNYLSSSSNFNHIYVVGGETSVNSTSINVFISNTFYGNSGSSNTAPVNNTSDETVSDETSTNSSSNQYTSDNSSDSDNSSGYDSSSSQSSETVNDNSYDDNDYNSSNSSGYSETNPNLFEFSPSYNIITRFKKANIDTLVIPSTINGVTVKKIGGSVFASRGIHTLILPDTIEDIGTSAFENNNISTINLPDNLKVISGSAFSGNDIKNLYIPASVSEIWDFAFSKNGMDTLDFSPDNKVGPIGLRAFIHNNLTSVVLPKTAHTTDSFDENVNITYRK